MWPPLEKHTLIYVLKWIWHYWYIIEPEWRFWTGGHWCRVASAQRVLVQTPACPYAFSHAKQRVPVGFSAVASRFLRDRRGDTCSRTGYLRQTSLIPRCFILMNISIDIDRQGGWLTPRDQSNATMASDSKYSVALNDIIKRWINFWSNIVIHSMSLFIKAHWLILLQQRWAMNCPSIIIILHIM